MVLLLLLRQKLIYVDPLSIYNLIPEMFELIAENKGKVNGPAVFGDQGIRHIKGENSLGVNNGEGNDAVRERKQVVIHV